MNTPHNPDSLTPEQVRVSAEARSTKERADKLIALDRAIAAESRARTTEAALAAIREMWATLPTNDMIHQDGCACFQCSVDRVLSDGVGASLLAEISELREKVAVLQSQVDNADVNLEQVRMAVKGITAAELSEAKKDGAFVDWIEANPEHPSFPAYQDGSWGFPVLCGPNSSLGAGIGFAAFPSLREALRAATAQREGK